MKLAALWNPGLLTSSMDPETYSGTTGATSIPLSLPSDILYFGVMLAALDVPICDTYGPDSRRVQATPANSSFRQYPQRP